MLYRPEAFEPLTEAPWDAARVRDAIAGIVAEADAAYDEKALWPAHEWDGWHAALPMKSLYVGAAGVAWALDALRRRGHAESRLDLPRVAHCALELWRDEPDLMAGIELPEPARAGLLSGESGILAVAWLLAPEDGLADDLHARAIENAGNPANEVMWGSPGTMLSARLLLDRTGDGRWAEAWRRSAEALLADRDAEGLWTQRLYGAEYRGLGPPHGVVGNVLALLAGGELLEDATQRGLEHETAAVLRRTAVLGDGLANWPGSVGNPLERDGVIRVQWCAGAPGVVVSARRYLDEDLLLAGAGLAWRAGPPGPEKGPCICHGTAGNGYALLAAFERTGDERWLGRARRFAVHALEQVRRRPRRFSLWTGDVGVALYAADCLDARIRYPVMDGWD